MTWSKIDPTCLTITETVTIPWSDSESIDTPKLQIGCFVGTWEGPALGDQLTLRSFKTLKVRDSKRVAVWPFTSDNEMTAKDEHDVNGGEKSVFTLPKASPYAISLRISINRSS